MGLFSKTGPANAESIGAFEGTVEAPFSPGLWSLEVRFQDGNECSNSVPPALIFDAMLSSERKVKGRPKKRLQLGLGFPKIDTSGWQTRPLPKSLLTFLFLAYRVVFPVSGSLWPRTVTFRQSEASRAGAKLQGAKSCVSPALRRVLPHVPHVPSIKPPSICKSLVHDARLKCYKSAGSVRAGLLKADSGCYRIPTHLREMPLLWGQAPG